MFFKEISLALALLMTSAAAADKDHRQLYMRGGEEQWDFYALCRKGHPGDLEMNLKVTLRNLAYGQPMSPFFIAVHNEDADDLFRLGSPATMQLGDLAETASTTGLETLFGTDSNVKSVQVEFGPDVPVLRAGEEITATVTVSCDYPYVSMASMAVNTNDCFVGMNHVMLKPGTVFTTPGYDAGTEANNEDCDYIPGPACEGESNLRTEGEGEGVVGIHRGVHGVWNGEESDLDPSLYDWRNPLLEIAVEKAHSSS